MKVVVGSTNPVKINAVKLAFEKVWPNKKWEVSGIKVSSGVSDQPMSDRECIRGAKNRAKNVLRSTECDFAIGIEGGGQKIGKNWFEVGWIIVIDKNKKLGIGSSAKCIVPNKIMKLLLEGRELESANDVIFGTKNSKQNDGHFGLMTNGVVTRTSAYSDGVVVALSCFIHPELFEE